MSAETAAAARLLLVPEVAAQLRESDWTVRQLIRRGDLVAIRVGRGRRGAYRIEQSAVDAFLSARRTASPTT
ncbi:MAG: helix-turn-helix domain-containing protein [Cellulomonas sp.]|uniref:helix-turn-helix domain-containing protein n=1 Tax=Cellulomonas sp. TaxID=40001 RepID=UPI002586EFFE|nr:helix-turn-helix domain-containing protein [Cellulomonas sp.]MCR6706579.1 helix-turn-helix domain-containing protein [Cellulomonas sp.]